MLNAKISGAYELMRQDEMNKASLSVLMLPRYSRNGPSSRQRLFIYSNFLSERCIRVIIEPFFSDAYLERQYAGQRHDWLDIAKSYAHRIAMASTAPGYDVVWIEKKVLPWLPGAFERQLIGHVPAMVDFDDAWHLRYQQAQRHRWSRAISSKLPEPAAM